MSIPPRDHPTTAAPATWPELLQQAVNVPGTLHAAYSAFHDYSVGNQLLALWQCTARGIEPGPIATFPSWIAKGRHVRKGEKAIVLCQPRTYPKVVEQDGEEREETRVSFCYRPAWFVLSQTDGEPMPMPQLPTWDRSQVLETLGLTEIPFTSLDGNTQGYAYPNRREIAVSPLAALPMKTTLHELAHVLLHAGEALGDTDQLPRNLKEVEAEAVAFLVSDALGLEGAEYSRGYIQNWLGTEEVPEASARRIFHAADQILRAGHQGPLTVA